MTHYPIVFEREDNGTISAYVAGLPIYAAADSRAQAERAIRTMLSDYLNTAMAISLAPAEVRVARVTGSARSYAVTIVSPAALVGRSTSKAKARSSRTNGKLGGRPRRTRAARSSRVRNPKM